ncbi:prolyl oligopeptidase family protein [Artemisia annua]|uniref:Prolyl oligopeptidase family protein n=1 Tax=Artemisia annua TaxID=35608 RepID=A0A2U1L7S6_ARTAN|nr:prolyl oligopeptidase family protein [Artemisia annua]
MDHENTHGGGDDQGSLLSQSMRLEVPKFNGTDPENWIFAIYEYFDLIATLNEQRLQIVAFNMEGDVAECFHGMSVLDPYRWLEDLKLEEEVELTEYVFKKFETQEKLQNELTKFYDYPKFAAPFREADKYFHFHNSGLQPQKVMDMQDSLDGKAEVLLDLNRLSEDGTMALSTYALCSSGSDWVTVQGMWIDGKKVEPDTLSWVKMFDVGTKREPPDVVLKYESVTKTTTVSWQGNRTRVVVAAMAGPYPGGGCSHGWRLSEPSRDDHLDLMGCLMVYLMENNVTCLILLMFERGLGPQAFTEITICLWDKERRRDRIDQTREKFTQMVGCQQQHQMVTEVSHVLLANAMRMPDTYKNNETGHTSKKGRTMPLQGAQAVAPTPSTASTLRKRRIAPTSAAGRHCGFTCESKYNARLKEKYNNTATSSKLRGHLLYPLQQHQECIQDHRKSTTPSIIAVAFAPVSNQSNVLD